MAGVFGQSLMLYNNQTNTPNVGEDKQSFTQQTQDLENNKRNEFREYEKEEKKLTKSEEKYKNSDIHYDYEDKLKKQNNEFEKKLKDSLKDNTEKKTGFFSPKDELKQSSKEKNENNKESNNIEEKTYLVRFKSKQISDLNHFKQEVDDDVRVQNASIKRIHNFLDVLYQKIFHKQDEIEEKEVESVSTPKEGLKKESKKEKESQNNQSNGFLSKIFSTIGANEGLFNITMAGVGLAGVSLFDLAKNAFDKVEKMFKDFFGIEEKEEDRKDAEYFRKELEETGEIKASDIKEDGNFLSKLNPWRPERLDNTIKENILKNEYPIEVVKALQAEMIKDGNFAEEDLTFIQNYISNYKDGDSTISLGNINLKDNQSFNLDNLNSLNNLQTINIKNNNDNSSSTDINIDLNKITGEQKLNIQDKLKNSKSSVGSINIKNSMGDISINSPSSEGDSVGIDSGKDTLTTSSSSGTTSSSSGTVSAPRAPTSNIEPNKDSKVLNEQTTIGNPTENITNNIINEPIVSNNTSGSDDYYEWLDQDYSENLD